MFIVLIFGGCATYKKPLPEMAAEKPAASAQVFKFSEKARQARLAAMVFDLPIGHRYGEASAGDGTCYFKQPMVNTKAHFNYDVTKYTDLFTSTMKKHGYPVDDKVELFENSKERVADLQIAGRIIDATLNACYPEYRNDLKAKGNAYLKIEWSVYSTLEKKVIFVATTEGSTYREVESNVGEPGILRPAVADALERLAVDPKYRQVIDPPEATTEVAKTAEAKIKIRRVKEYTGDLKSHINLIKAAVATVTANRGSGSGFIISEDGAVLTAEHVVSGSKFVKVKTATGKECYGEVVASSKQRDIAIVHLDCKGLTALPMSRQQIVEGNEVFAIGTPLSDKLQFSVTKGVVSGLRKIDEIDYIQSDVTVLPGSSGGPLLDSRGNVVGITSMGVAPHSVPVGVNFFVPVTDLDKYVPIDFE
jgi:S1-C subfamily serine protease